MMPLMLAPEGETLKIERCTCSGELKKHIESLGVIPGEEITVVSRNGGNVIVKIKESRFGIQQKVAAQIYVTA